MARRASAGAPARLALLLVAALVAGIACVAAAPAACPTSGNATVCVGCAAKSCKFDDNCHLNKAGQAKRGICQDLGDGETVGATDMCSGIQRKHGKNAPTDVGGPGKKKARCNAKSVTKPGYTTSGCQCVNKQGNNLNKKGNPVKKCKRCQQKEAITPVVDTPPPPPTNASPPPPPVDPVDPTGCFIPGCTIVTQWGNYEPSTKDSKGVGWARMCSLAPQARSINYAMSQDPRSFALAESVWDGVVGAYGGKALNEPAFAGNTYFDNAALYAGGGTADTKFLNTYFQTGLIGAGPGGCGTNNSKGRAEILKKTSQDWVPVTWIMKYLDEAASKIAAGGTANVALAKTAYDYVAGAYFGCGENNPVALPTTPNITYGGKTHQLEGPTYWTPASTAQKRSSNYDQQETVGNTTNLATKVVNVMKELNVGPTASGISVIKDAILTVYSQATLRYTAKLTLGAHLPGNGMGGSTKPTEIINPAISTGVTACGVNQIGKAVTDCSKSSGCTAQEAGAPKSESDFELPLCCNIAANQWSNYKDANVRPKVLNTEAGAGLGYVEWNQVAAVAEAQAAAKNNPGVAPKSSDTNGKNLRKAKNNNAGLTYPTSAQYAVNSDGTVKQPTSGCTNLRANALGVGNSLATTEWAQFPVAASAASLTCTEVWTGGPGIAIDTNTASGQANGAGVKSDGSVANSKLNCIGPSVGFLTPYYIGGKWASEPAVTTGADAWIYNTFDQSAAVGSAKGAGGNPFDNAVTFQASKKQVQSVGPNPNTIATNDANNPFGADGAWGTAGKFKGARQNFAYLSADITMATTGADKDYARLATADHQFAPIRAGDSGNNMGGETSKACVTGADGGNTAKTSNSKAGSGSSDTEIKNQLEGQAFFQVIAGQMSKQTVANAPKDSSGNTLVLSNTHKNCAANIANMLAFNTAAIVKTNAGAVPSKAVKGDKPNAISFPTWSVAIGDKPLAADFNYYVVPNGFCYVNQCLESYLTSATSDKGAGYGTLVSSPNMGKPGSGTCGLATASCASLSAYRVANAAPLAYTCSQLGSDEALPAGKTEPSVCGDTTFAVETAAGVRAPPTYAGNYADGQASAKNVFYITGALAVSSWDGKEWPAPLQTTGDFIGAPVV